MKLAISLSRIDFDPDYVGRKMMLLANAQGYQVTDLHAARVTNMMVYFIAVTLRNRPGVQVQMHPEELMTEDAPVLFLQRLREKVDK